MKEFLPKSAAKMADCLMKRYGLLTSRWSYDYGVAWRGMEALYAMTGEKKYFDYIKDAMDTFVTDESGAIRDYTLDEFNLDYICNGRQLLYLYKATGDKKYLRAADVLALLPENHECFEPLRALMEKISARMLEIRVDGAWLQVLDCPGREGNYLESSGSCLMTAAILKAAANHQLPDWMLTAAQESFRAIQRHFVGQMRDGTLFLAKTCYGAGLGGKTDAYRDGSYDYYISETVGSYDIKGTGAYIQAACAYEGSDPHA